MKEKEKSLNVFNKHNFAIHALCDKSRMHRGLREGLGIRITSNFTEVTNGHYLFRIPTPDVNKDDLPMCNEILVEKKVNFVITSEAAQDIEKNIPKSFMPILENAWLVESEDKETVSFVMTNLDAKKKISSRPLNVCFPDTDSVWPKGPAVVEIDFDLDYMIKLCQQFAKSDNRQVKILRLKIYGASSAMVLESTKDDEQKPKALLMPCKT